MPNRLQIPLVVLEELLESSSKHSLDRARVSQNPHDPDESRMLHTRSQWVPSRTPTRLMFAEVLDHETYCWKHTPITKQESQKTWSRSIQKQQWGTNLLWTDWQKTNFSSQSEKHSRSTSRIHLVTPLRFHTVRRNIQAWSCTLKASPDGEPCMLIWTTHHQNPASSNPPQYVHQNSTALPICSI